MKALAVRGEAMQRACGERPGGMLTVLGLGDDETVAAAYKGSRDMVIFTSKRVVAVNVQGITGKKIDYSSMPYSRIQAFSVETAGAMDRDSELEMWFSGLGKVRLEFGGSVDITWVARWLAHHRL